MTQVLFTWAPLPIHANPGLFSLSVDLWQAVKLCPIIISFALNHILTTVQRDTKSEHSCSLEDNSAVELLGHCAVLLLVSMSKPKRIQVDSVSCDMSLLLEKSVFSKADCWGKCAARLLDSSCSLIGCSFFVWVFLKDDSHWRQNKTWCWAHWWLFAGWRSCQPISTETITFHWSLQNLHGEAWRNFWVYRKLYY